MSRILVIDDDRSVRHLIAKAFEDTDVQVVPAATAEEGMHLLGEAQSDVVLLDILLPESTGLELFERVRLSVETARPSPHPRPRAASDGNPPADEHSRRHARCP